MLIWLLVLTFKGIGEKPARETVIPLMATLMIMVAVEADSLTGESMAVSFLTIAMVSACMFFYIWLHLMFVREHEDALLAEQRIRIGFLREIIIRVGPCHGLKHKRKIFCGSRHRSGCVPLCTERKHAADRSQSF